MTSPARHAGESFDDFKQRRIAEEKFLKEKKKGSIFYNPYRFEVKDGELVQLKSVSYRNVH